MADLKGITIPDRSVAIGLEESGIMRAARMMGEMMK